METSSQVVGASTKPPASEPLDWGSEASFAGGLGLGRLVASQYYELRLGEAFDQIDYLVAFSGTRAARLREALGAHLEGADPGWNAIGQLLRLGEDPTTLTGSRQPTIWFEFDDFGRQNNERAPSVSCCITRDYSVTTKHRAQAEEDLKLTRELLDHLGAGDSETSDRINLAFACLPPAARWIHVSCMLGRTPRAVKLYGALDRGDLIPFLEKIGWVGDRAAIEFALDRLYPQALLGNSLFIDLNLDNFRDPLGCSLGLAVAQQHLSLGPEPDPARTRVLEIWTRHGLCSRSKVAAVSSWPASSNTIAVGPFEKEFRYLDLKLVWQRSSGFVAKAYLGRQRLVGLY